MGAKPFTGHSSKILSNKRNLKIIILYSDPEFWIIICMWDREYDLDITSKNYSFSSSSQRLSTREFYRNSVVG